MTCKHDLDDYEKNRDSHLEHWYGYPKININIFRSIIIGLVIIFSVMCVYMGLHGIN